MATYRKIPVKGIVWLCFTMWMHTAAAQQQAPSDLINQEDSSLVYEGCMGWLFKDATDSKVISFPSSPASFKKPSLLSIHGDVSYDFQYRSLLDTPYYQKDFRQHTLQANLNIVYKEKYPFRLVIRQVINNSPFFRDRIDLNARLSEQILLTHMKKLLAERSADWTQQHLQPLYAKADSLKQVYEALRRRIDQLAITASDENIFAELVRAKELFIDKKLQEKATEIGNVDSLRVLDKEILKRNLLTEYDSLLRQGASAWLTDTGSLSPLSRIKESRRQFENETKQLEDIQNRLNRVERGIADSLAAIKQQLNRVTNTEELKEYVRTHEQAGKVLPKGWKTLMAVKNIGIGRCWLDYSELTIKNISLTGGHIELNHGRIYLAAGIGRVNARFRDFIVAQQAGQRSQQLHFLRLGWGRKERSSFILSYYKGRRFTFDSRTDSLIAGLSPYQKVVGVSLENTIRINEHNKITVEIARSSFSTATNQSGQGNEWKQILNMRDRNNEAYSIRFQSYWPSSYTSLSGFYKKTGAHFQSFNLQPVSVRQEAYAFKLKQQLWRQRLMIEAGIRKNDFSSPFANPGLQSKTVFKSLLAHLRIPRLPALLIGFYPSTQLTVLSNNSVIENQYNTLTGILTYTYPCKGAMATTHLSYLRFFNNSDDTSFIYYNARNWSLSHNMSFPTLQWQTGFSYAERSDFRLVTIEQSIGVQVKKWLHLQGGLKYNTASYGAVLWGGVGGLILDIPKLGRFQFQYERSFLPGMNRNLLPVEMGRFNFYKVF